MNKSVPIEYTDAQLAAGVAQLRAARALGVSDESIVGVIYDGMLAAHPAPSQAAAQPTAWLNDMGTEQKLSFAPIPGAYEHQALVLQAAPVSPSSPLTDELKPCAWGVFSGVCDEPNSVFTTEKEAVDEAALANGCAQFANDGGNTRVEPLVRSDHVRVLTTKEAPAAPVSDEREAFEKRYSGDNLKRDGEGYKNPFVDSAWDGWQDRAYLAARQLSAPPAPGAVAYMVSHPVTGEMGAYRFRAQEQIDDLVRRGHTLRPLTYADMPVSGKLLDTIMEQVQVFASAWAMVGGPFDVGTAMENAEAEKVKLRQWFADLLAASPPAQAMSDDVISRVKDFICDANWDSHNRRVYSFLESDLPKLARALSRPAIPEGWKLVPIEPTPKMRKAGQAHTGAVSATYRDMIAASPSAPKETGN